MLSSDSIASALRHATICEGGKIVRVVSTCGLVGLGGGFLLISPQLRESLVDLAGRGQLVMSTYEPYSYIGLGAIFIVALGWYMYRCAQPR